MFYAFVNIQCETQSAVFSGPCDLPAGPNDLMRPGPRSSKVWNGSERKSKCNKWLSSKYWLSVYIGLLTVATTPAWMCLHGFLQRPLTDSSRVTDEGLIYIDLEIRWSTGRFNANDARLARQELDNDRTEVHWGQLSDARPWRDIREVVDSGVINWLDGVTSCDSATGWKMPCLGTGMRLGLIGLTTSKRHTEATSASSVVIIICPVIIIINFFIIINTSITRRKLQMTKGLLTFNYGSLKLGKNGCCKWSGMLLLREAVELSFMHYSWTDWKKFLFEENNFTFFSLTLCCVCVFLFRWLHGRQRYVFISCNRIIIMI